MQLKPPVLSNRLRLLRPLASSKKQKLQRLPVSSKRRKLLKPLASSKKPKKLPVSNKKRRRPKPCAKNKRQKLPARPRKQFAYKKSKKPMN